MTKTKLKQSYEEFLSLPFPKGNQEAVANWIAELAEVDGYYAGLAESLIQNQPLKVYNLPSLDPLFHGLKKLHHHPGISENQYREYKHYLLTLEKLAKEI